MTFKTNLIKARSHLIFLFALACGLALVTAIDNGGGASEVPSEGMTAMAAFDDITPLPLANNVVAALLNREGDLGEALNCVLSQELDDWINIRFANLSQTELSDINIEAINWAEDVLNSI